MSPSSVHAHGDPSWMYRSEAFAEDLPESRGTAQGGSGLDLDAGTALRPLRAWGWYAATVALALLAAWPAATRWA